MGHWLVNTNSLNIEISSEGKDIFIKSSRVPKISTGDHIVFLEGGDIQAFKRAGEVTYVEVIEKETNQESNVIHVRLQEVVSLPAGLVLEDFWYSFTFIRNTRKPWIHFQRGYRRIQREDFETLRIGEPFVARSGFYELFNALPRGLKAEFEIETIRNHSIRGERENYSRRLERLNSFLEERVFHAGDLIANTQALVIKLDLRDREGQLYEHVFADDAGRRSRKHRGFDELEEQERRFSGLRDELSKPLKGEPDQVEKNVVRAILLALAQPEYQQAQERFENIFRKNA